MGKKQQNQDVKRMQAASLTKMIAMVGIVVAVLAFSSIAWFTMNREVEGAGVQMRADDLPFDIATKGTSVRNSARFAAEKPEYETGESRTITENHEDVVYYTADSLKLRYDPSANDSDIAPGGSGELSLYIIPKTNETLNVKVSFEVTAFAAIEDMSGNGQEKIIEIKDAADFASKANAVNNSIAAANAEDYVAAANYLEGHILFFGGQGDTTNSTESRRYYYTTPYTARTFDKQISAGNEGKTVQIPVYWMWTNTLGQIALKNNDTNQMNGIPVVQNIAIFPNTPLTDKEKVIQYVKDNKDIVLKDWRNILSDTEELVTIPEMMLSSQITTEKATELLVDGLIDDIADTENFSRLSKCYNAADYEIGTRIAYFMIEVTVKQASQN